MGVQAPIAAGLACVPHGHRGFLGSHAVFRYLLSGSDIELSIYSDRLEIESPGRLANWMTIERMRAGCRSARNELLNDVMRDCHSLEHVRMGMPRKIIRGMREHNGTEPDLIEADERFTVQLWKDLTG